MFTYIRLKNFKSFGDVTVDFTDRNGNPKKLILVYGENGIGKSNLVSAFYMLLKTFNTMNVRDLFQHILENDPENYSDENMMTFLKSTFQDMETLIKDNKMVDSKDNLYMEFGFELNKRKGKYILEMNDTEIVYESLEYLLMKNKGIHFKITNDKAFLSDKVFCDKSVMNDLKGLINKFWGKHTFLSLIYYDIHDKKKGYYDDKISKNLQDVLLFFDSLSCHVKSGNGQKNYVGFPSHYLNHYESGTISLKNEDVLDKTEKMLNVFITSIYNDIDSVFYKRKIVNDEIRYNLFVRKKIYGQIRDINFNLESTGTIALIDLLPYMLAAVEGSVAVIDEFDTGIHDILVTILVSSINQYIKGQLIMTTHNTLLMESDIHKEYFYTIDEVDGFDKQIECVLKYDNKISENTNLRNQYLKGRYKGVPDSSIIDFDKLIKLIKDLPL